MKTTLYRQAAERFHARPNCSKAASADPGQGQAKCQEFKLLLPGASTQPNVSVPDLACFGTLAPNNLCRFYVDNPSDPIAPAARSGHTALETSGLPPQIVQS